MIILVLIATVFVIIEGVPWDDIFKLGASAAAAGEFC